MRSLAENDDLMVVVRTRLEADEEASAQRISAQLPSIAEKFVRNHATVLHAVNSVKAKIDTDEDFRREIGIIEHKIKNS